MWQGTRQRRSRARCLPCTPNSPAVVPYWRRPAIRRGFPPRPTASIRTLWVSAKFRFWRGRVSVCWRPSNSLRRVEKSPRNIDRKILPPVSRSWFCRKMAHRQPKSRKKVKTSAIRDSAVNQSINQEIKKSRNETINQSINRSIEQSIVRSINRSKN